MNNRINIERIKQIDIDKKETKIRNKENITNGNFHYEGSNIEFIKTADKQSWAKWLGSAGFVISGR